MEYKLIRQYYSYSNTANGPIGTQLESIIVTWAKAGWTLKSHAMSPFIGSGEDGAPPASVGEVHVLVLEREPAPAG